MHRLSTAPARHIVTIALAVWAIMIHGPRVEAAPIFYDEAVSGDLSANVPAPSVFQFDLGLNVVSGSSFYLPFATGETGDMDSFAFLIPAGLLLTDARFVFDASLTPTTLGADSSYVFGPGNDTPQFPFLYFISLDLLQPSPITWMNAILPIGPGTYTAQNSGLSVGGFVEPTLPGWTMDYRWEFTLTRDGDVPEPGLLALLPVGLVAFGMLRARRR
jgi:hypothetical protein